MPHMLEELAAEAASAIVSMRQVAMAARHLHARAELMRHMLATARKAIAGRTRAEAVELVVREWMAAWALDRGAWPDVAREMEALTAAFLDVASAPPGPQADAADSALRTACAGLDAALALKGTTLSDEMAWRSECAHGWWQSIRPVPPGLQGARPRPNMPRPQEGVPFWEAACAPHCR